MVQPTTEPVQKGTKVPPPVAKKPKSKGKEFESEGTEPTAGQEEQQESSMGKSVEIKHDMSTLTVTADVCLNLRVCIGSKYKSANITQKMER